MEHHPVVLYDGPCTLCNKSVQWIYKRDHRGQFRFAALQGNWAKSHVPEHLRKIDSVLFFDGVKWHTKSTALLEIIRRLSLPWSLLYILWLVPKFLRDFMYENCAARRYFVFGQGYCAMVPKDRLLDE